MEFEKGQKVSMIILEPHEHPQQFACSGSEQHGEVISEVHLPERSELHLKFMDKKVVLTIFN